MYRGPEPLQSDIKCTQDLKEDQILCYEINRTCINVVKTVIMVPRPSMVTLHQLRKWLAKIAKCVPKSTSSW